MNQAESIFPSKRRLWISIFVVAIVFAITAIRQHRLVDQNSVNVLYWDQWDLYKPLQTPTGWGLFDSLHGPYRQGAGALLTGFIAEQSHWNSRWNAFGVSEVLIAAAGMGLVLAWRCGVREPLAFAAVPLLYLTRRQWEDFVGASNIADAAMPIFLLTACCLCLFIRNVILHITAVAAFTILLIFTGPGLFAGFIVPMLLALELFQAFVEKETAHSLAAAGGIGAIAVGWIAFRWHYVPVPLLSSFPYEKPIEYLCFIGTMISNLFGLRTPGQLSVVFGLLITALLLMICLIHAWQMLRYGVAKKPTSSAIILLAGFSMLFCVDTAADRVALGWQTQSMSSHLVTLVIPAGLAIFLHVGSLGPPRMAAMLGVIFSLVISYGSLTLSPAEWDGIHKYRDGKTAWRAAYLAAHNVTQADAVAKFQVYPNPAAMTDQLQFMQQHRLNIFREAN